MHRDAVPRLLIAAAVTTLLISAASAALAGSILVNATDSGWYNSTGYHDPANTNYATGDLDNNVEYRSFYVFSIPTSLTNSNHTLLSAELRLYNPSNGYTSPNSSEEFNATIVSTNVATLRAGGSGLTGIFNDLGVGGGVYAQRVISSSEVGRLITVDLGSTANSSILSRAGLEFAVGGASDTLGVANNEETVFGYSSSSYTRALLLNFADADLSVANANFGSVLVTTTGQASITVRNSGEAGSTLTGSIGSSSNSEITPASGSSPFSLGAGASASKTFTYAPTARGLDSATISITSNDGSITRTASGRGVAPVERLNASAAAAGDVRLGTSDTVSAIIQNIGDGNLSGLGATSNLRGDFSLGSSSSEFSGTAGGSISLPDGASQTLSYTYTPADRVADSRTLTLNYYNGSNNGQNQANTQFATFTGNGVGPEFTSSIPVGSTIDFGEVLTGSVATMPLTLWNLTPDGDLESLTDLTIFDVIFSGPDNWLFLLSSPIVGTVLAADDALVFNVLFQTTDPFGPRNATLTIVTDQNAPFGSAGDAFSFQLQGLVVPEPSSLALLALGAAGAVGYGWRRKRKHTPSPLVRHSFV
jgi:hypothetical protein